jgi:hypothetical protein
MKHFVTDLGFLGCGNEEALQAKISLSSEFAWAGASVVSESLV